jgi:uracil-DNA glycosylase family 4
MDGDVTEANGQGAAAPLQALAGSLADCRRCGLCQHRTQVVFGVGNPEPFVGAAGKLLNELLGGIGLSRADVYIANVVKCRPPENRDPTPEEIEACSPHLMEQIAIIRPSVICTLGRFATKLLAETELSITAIHGKAKEKTLAGVHTVLFPVFHPAAALYAPANRQVLAEDFAKLRLLLRRGTEALAPPPGGRGCTDEGSPGAHAESGAGPLAPQSHRSEPPRTEQLHLW